MKYFIIVLLLMFSITIHAQEVEKDGKTYEVKKEKIFLDGEEVTETLSTEEAASILESARIINEKLAASILAEKEVEKMEKEMKKAQKAQQKAEKALEKKQKAQERFEKAGERLETAQKKYEKLKKKGKLSPNDEEKWLKKLKDLQKDIDKAKRKM